MTDDHSWLFDPPALIAALRYAELGWPVLPCKADKAPASPHGLHDATSAAAELRELWKAHPGEAVGLLVVDGAMVLDIDDTGVLEPLRIDPDTWPGPVATTPSGGYHLLCSDPRPDGQRGNSSGKLPKGVDVRAGGKGYVVAPIGEGRLWLEYIVRPDDLPPCPEHIAALLMPPKRAQRPPTRRTAADRDLAPYVEAALRGEADRMRGACEGERNSTLNRCALALGQLAAHGLSQSDAESELVGAAMDVGLPEREARKTFASGWRAGEREPRAIPEGRSPNCCDAPPPHEDEDAPPGADKPPAALPYIQISTNEPVVNDAAIRALAGAAHDDLYQRDGSLVRVIRHRCLPTANDSDKKLRVPDGHPLISGLHTATLRERLAGAAVWLRFDKRAGQAVPAHPPPWCVTAVGARGTWDGIPVIRGVTDYPLLRADGSIHMTAGYDPITGYYSGGLPSALSVKDKPTIHDAEAAVGLLLELVEQFPFEAEIDKAVWLAFLLTPLARAIIDGPTPLFLYSANTRSCGKTLLMTIAGVILTGRPIAAQTYPKQEEELEKILVAVARMGLPMLLFDNVDVVLGGATLDKWVTSTRPSGRILGESDVVLFDWGCVLAATSNNASIHGDSDRRIIRGQLKTDLEHPEARDDIRIPNLVSYTIAHRAEFLSAAITVLRAYIMAGSPEQGGRVKGSFETWGRVVRDALMWAGLPDCERPSDDPGRQVDQSVATMGPLLAALREEFAGAWFGVGEIFEAAYPAGNGDLYHRGSPALKEALGVIAVRGDRPTMQALGRRLGKYRDRWFGGLKLESERDQAKRSLNWRVVTR